MHKRSLLTTVVTGALLVAGFAINAAEADQGRPTLKEIQPLMQQAAANTMATFFSQTPLKPTGRPLAEILEIGSPGWAPLDTTGKEEKFWPVKVKATTAISLENGTTNLTQGLVFRLYRGGTTNWQVAFGDFFEPSTLSERAQTLGNAYRENARVRTIAIRNACINYQRQLDGAKEQWALENKKKGKDTPKMEDLVGTDKYIKRQPVCPGGGTYTLGSMSEKARCSVAEHRLE
ncbi:MAG: hypothetical protein WCO56_17140 [Verrucomicrobiota bacterium]